MAERLRIIYFGTGGYYSSIPLKALISEHDVLAIYSDTRPAGKSTSKQNETLFQSLVKAGKNWIGNNHTRSISNIAEEYDIPYRQVETVNTPEIIEELRRYNADLICISSFNRILKPDVLEIPGIGVLNAHSSLLPDYRGPNPFFWIVKDQALSCGGCTLHWAVSDVDAGAIIAKHPVKILQGMTAEEYKLALAFPVADLYQTVLRQLLSGNIPGGVPNKQTTTPFCRNPRQADLQLDLSYSVSYARWFLKVALDYGIPYVKIDGKKLPCKKLLASAVPGAIEVSFADGTLWISNE